MPPRRALEGRKGCRPPLSEDQPCQRLLSAPNRPPAVLYPPELASQPFFATALENPNVDALHFKRIPDVRLCETTSPAVVCAPSVRLLLRHRQQTQDDPMQRTGGSNAASGS